MAETPQEKVFKYVLERRLAAGGMGEVFLAKEEGTDKVCVIKRMLPNLMSDNQFVTMFLDEAKLAAQLNHPNIAPLYDFGMSGGVLYLSMEYVPGANLRVIVKDHAARKVPMPFDSVARIMSQAALALDYAHQATTAEGKPLKLVHRDVSPQNILLGTNGVVKLIDFGVAKAATASQVTAAGLIKGKYAYMSPEQVRGQPLDGRSDIFGLGLVLYELLAGERAIPGKTDAEVAQNSLHMRFAPIRQKRPDIPDKLEAILNKALQRDARERYQRASELSSDLERYLADRRVSPTGAELAKLLPMPTNPAPSVPSAPVRTEAPNVPWKDATLPPTAPKERVFAPTRTTPSGAFWENQPPAMTDVSTEEGLPPTQQLTPSQLPMLKKPNKQADASEAPTMHVGNVKLPPPPSRPPSSNRLEPVRVSQQSTPMTPRPSPGEAPTQHVKDLQLPPPPPSYPAPRASLPPPPVPSRPEPQFVLSPPPPAPEVSESAIQRAVRRGIMPWIISAIVLVIGAIALVAGFMFVNRKQLPTPPQPQPVAQPQPTPAPKPVALPTPPAPVPATPDAAVAVAPPTPEKPAKPPPVDSALVEVTSSVPARVSIDGAASGSAPVELSVAPGAHTLIFTDMATGLQHKRVISLTAGDHRREAWNPERGKLVVRASPWAEVFVGEHSFGVTPMDAPIELVAGRHQFRFVNSDTKRTVQRIVDVPAGKETLVKVDLR